MDGHLHEEKRVREEDDAAIKVRKVLEQKRFWIDVIYNHQHLEKILGLLKSIKKKDNLSEILETFKNYDIEEEEDENLEIFLREIRNYLKGNGNRRREMFKSLKVPTNSPSSDILNRVGDSDTPAVKNKKRIRIYADGVFDLVHSGHFNAIRQAKKLGDVLVVGVNSDKDVLKSKGFSPIYTEEERAELIRGCKWVDEVIVGTKYCVDMELLNKYNCDYAAHGNDLVYDTNGVNCYEDIKRHNRLKIFERSYGISTTAMIKHLLLAVEKNGVSALGNMPPGVIDNTPLKNMENGGILKTRNETHNDGDGSVLLSNEQTDVEEKASENSVGNIINKEEEVPQRDLMGANTGAYFSGRDLMQDAEQLERMDYPEIENGLDTKTAVDKQRYYMTASRLYDFISDDPKKERKNVVYVDGSFDIFHVGHLRILENAKKLGDFLIVGVHDDEVVKKMKGEYFPVVSLLERTLNVLAMKVVDDVVIGAPWVITENFIKLFNIKTVVRGTKVDYVYLNNDIDPYQIPKKLNIYKEIPSDSNLTTLEIIERIEKKKIYLMGSISSRCKKEENIWKSYNPEMIAKLN